MSWTTVVHQLALQRLKNGIITKHWTNFSMFFQEIVEISSQKLSYLQAEIRFFCRHTRGGNLDFVKQYHHVDIRAVTKFVALKRIVTPSGENVIMYQNDKTLLA